MSRNYTRKDPGVWNREPVEELPTMPLEEGTTDLIDDGGHVLKIDREIDHLFHPNLRRHVWTEPDGTVYTEIYDTNFNSVQEQYPRKMLLAQFVYETYHINAQARETCAFIHNNGDRTDFRVCNLTRIRKYSLGHRR